MKRSLILAWIVMAMGASTLLATEGLVAYWPFDTDFTNAEGTVEYDGTPAGTAEISAEDVVVGAGALKIADDTASANHVTAMGDYVGPAPVVRTVVGWYKYADINGDGSDGRNFIWETQPTYSLSFGIRDGAAGKYAQWYHNTQTGAINDSGPTVDDGLWHHVALVWNSVRGHVKYYHDGELLQTVAIAMSNNPVLGQAGFNIGTHRSADGGRNWDGYLDEIAIFSVELSENQISELYEHPEAINPLNIFEQISEIDAYLIRPINGQKVYRDDVVLSWDASQASEAVYDVWLGPDPNALVLLAQGISDTEYTPVDVNDGILNYWKVLVMSPLGTQESEVASFEVYQNRGLVAYWPFDQDYSNVQGDGRYDGVEIDTGDCVDISTEAVKIGSGALKLNDNNPETHGLVQVNPSPFFGGQKSMTLCCWYNYQDIMGDGSTARPFVFETAPGNTISYGTRFEVEAGGMDMGEWYLQGTPGGSDVSGPIDPNPQGWHHVALVYNAVKGSMSFYYNGQLRDLVLGTPYETLGDGLGTDELLNIGDYRGANGERMFDGYIDDMAAFDVALSAKQVQALYEGTYEGQTITPLVLLDIVNDVYAKSLYPVGAAIPLDTDLHWDAPRDIDDPNYTVYFGTDPNTVLNQVHTTTSQTQLEVDLNLRETYYWRVDVVTDDAVYEGSLQEFSTIKGLLAYYSFDENLWTFNDDFDYDGEATGNALVSNEDVKVGIGALKIDDDTAGANLVTIEPSPFVAGQKQVTVCAWYKFKDISNNGYDARPFVIESNDYHISYGTRVEGDMLDAGEWYFRGNPGWSDTSGPLVPLDENKWHHFALVYNASQGYAEFYYDGELRDRVEADPGAGLNETSYINIGDYRSGNGGRNFDGYIDDVAFFDIVLNADQVKALYDSPETTNGGNILDQGL
jgi:hypothetical protein